MERCSIWGATIAQVRLSCYQFLLVASSPKFQSQQSLRSLQRQTYKSIPNLMWNPHQTIWSRANHRFLIRIIGLACWNCSSVPRLRQLAGICISLGTIRKSTSAELDEGGVLILPKCQVSKGCAMRGPQPYQILTKCGRACDFTSKALCSLPALTRRGLLRHLPWARPRWFLLKWWSWPEQFSQAFRPEPVRRRETCKQNPQTLLKFEENLQMTSNDHRLPAQVKSASLTLTLTLGHCALHFSGTSSPWLQNRIPQILWASLIPNLSAAEEANQCTPCNDAFPAGKGQLRINVFTLTLATGVISGPSKFRPWRRSDPQTAEYSLLPGDSTWCSITECLNHWRQERLCHSAVAGMASMHWVRLVSRQSRVWTAGTKIYLNSSIATFDLLPYISPCTYQSCCTCRDTPSRSSSEWQLLSLSHS